MNDTHATQLLARLSPVRDDELLAETHGPEARALLAHVIASPIAESRPRAARGLRRGRRRLAIPALAAAVAAVAITLLSTGGSTTPGAAAAVLRHVASVARARTPLTPGPGRYVYTKSVDAYVNTVVPTGGASKAFNVLVPHVREVWLGPAGGRLYQTDGTPQFPTSRDRERWLAAGKPDLGGPTTDAKLSPTPPLDLPTDANALYDRLKREASAPGDDNPVYVEMFTLIGDSLRESAATPAQRAALYEVAARLPGVELLGPVADTAGRSGIGVAMSSDGIRHTLILDSDTSALLGEEDVALPNNPEGYPSGFRAGYATYLAHTIVDSETATH